MFLILNMTIQHKPLVSTTITPGHRLTHQRKLILEILEESQEHLDAADLYLQAKARDAHISLATVYRTLAILKEAGLVQENQLGQDHGHFETTQPTPHYHFTCLKCGRVIEFEAPQVLEAAHELCKKEGIQVLEMHLLLSGCCFECRKGEPGCE